VAPLCQPLDVLNWVFDLHIGSLVHDVPPRTLALISPALDLSLLDPSLGGWLKVPLMGHVVLGCRSEESGLAA